MVSEAIEAELNRVSETFTKNAFLHREVGERLFQRLQVMKFAPESILEVGANAGVMTGRLATLYPNHNNITTVDFANKMQAVTQQKHPEAVSLLLPEDEKLLIADNSVDMVFSNLALQYLSDIEQVFSEVYRVLKPEGLFIFSMFGLDTLAEFCEVYANLHADVVAPFYDMHDIGDVLLKKQFAEPVMESEDLILAYQDFSSMFRELGGAGCFYFLPEAESICGQAGFSQAMEAFRDQDGAMPASFEIVMAHTWKPLKDKTTVSLNDNNEAAFSIDKLKKKSD